MHMKIFREQIINFIYKVVTGTKRMRLLLTPLFASIFFCIVLLLIFTSFYLDRFFELPEFISKPFSIVVSLPFLIIGDLMVVVRGEILKNKRNSCADKSSTEIGYRRTLRLFKKSNDGGSFYDNGRDWYLLRFDNSHIYNDTAVCFYEYS